MTSQKNFSTILTAVAKLTLDEQCELNELLCDMIKENRDNKEKLAKQFARWSIARFEKTGGRLRVGVHYMKVEKFARKGTHLVGYECDSAGNIITPAVKWIVPVLACSPYDPAA